MLYIFALQPSLSPLYRLKMIRRSLPTFNVPCELPEISCARATPPNIAASTARHSISFFMKHAPAKLGILAILRLTIRLNPPRDKKRPKCRSTSGGFKSIGRPTGSSERNVAGGRAGVAGDGKLHSAGGCV